jgi:biotin carboxylase
MAVLDLIGRRPLQAVLSFSELGLLPAALLATSLGVPGTPVAPVLRSRNKLQMRLWLAGRLHQPPFGIVGRDDPVRYPVVIKPVDGSGSRGIHFVPDAEAFAVCQDQVAGYLWEGYVLGREFSVETVTRNGVHLVIGVTEKSTTGPPYFVETAHLVPARLTESEYRRVVDATLHALTILGVDECAAHTEMKLVAGEAVIVETHTRPGGDRIPFLHKLVSGLDQFAMAVPPGLGHGQRPEPSRFKFAGVRYFRWPDGELAGIDGVSDAEGIPGVVEVGIHAAAGARLSTWQHSRERPVHCVVGAHSAEEVRRLLDRVEQLIRPRYRNLAPSGT